MKSFISALLACLLGFMPIHSALAVSFDSSDSSSEAVSSASSSQTIYISSESDLKSLGSKLSVNAVLTKDITISSSAWTPIGTIDSPYQGTFDGNGHTITYQLKSEGTTSVLVGLFGSVSGEIRNLTVEGSLTVSLTTGYVGTIAATVKDGGKIYNCSSSVTISANAKKNMACGGLVGTVLHNSSTSDTDGEIILSRYLGTMNLTVTSNTASDGTDLTDGTNGACGGILALIGNSATASINKCINSGNLTVNGGKYNVGGIVGQTSVNGSTVALISECANKGDIVVNNLAGERAAGIIGYVRCSTIEYCYNVGNIIAYKDNGKTVSTEGYGTYFGIFGYANLSDSNKLTVRYCYSYTQNPLEAEICTVRNPSYGTFQNYYQQGRSEYETSLNSNASAGTAGTAFSSLSDLTTKLTKATDKYQASSGSYPILSFETSHVLSASSSLDGYLLARQKDETHDLRIILISNGSISSGNVTISFSNGKKYSETFGQENSNLKQVSSFRASEITYVPASGQTFYSFIIKGLENDSWSTVRIQVTNGKKALVDTSVSSVDLFGETKSSVVPFTGLPDYPDGTVSSVYNCGPGKLSDKTALTGDESHMIIISGTKESSFKRYIATLTSSGFKQVDSNSIEKNLYYTLTKDGKIYYAYYTANNSEARIIEDTASTALLSSLSTSVANGTTEFYQYSIDYTEATGQTWSGDYWEIDCGMCYVIKLPDNSVFIIDGGHERQSSEASMKAFDDFLHSITGKSSDQKVTISGWFFSHAHGDHVYFTHAFLEEYHDRYDLKALYFNFPSYRTMSSGYDSGTFEMKDTVNKYYPNVQNYKLHTGQTFSIQGVQFEVLFTHEDAATMSGGTSISDFNATSTVLRISISGKTFLMLGDISTVSESCLLGMYSTSTLQSDAVQVAHHAYNYLNKLYAAVSADLILIPNSKANATSSENQPKINAAIKAAKNPDILYAGDATSKIMVKNGEFVVTSLDRYDSSFYFELPVSLEYPKTATTVAEKPISDSIISSFVDLTSLIIDKSGRGTNGANSSETPQLLLDGNTATKWCVTTGTPAYIGFKTYQPVTVTAYQLWTANDTASHTDRNPKSWVLYGSTDGVTWEVIDAVQDGGMSTTNYTASTYAVDSPAAYSYYFLKIYSLTGSANTMQLSDIRLFGSLS